MHAFLKLPLDYFVYCYLVWLFFIHIGNSLLKEFYVISSSSFKIKILTWINQLSSDTGCCLSEVKQGILTNWSKSVFGWMKERTNKWMKQFLYQHDLRVYDPWGMTFGFVHQNEDYGIPVRPWNKKQKSKSPLDPYLWNFKGPH